MGYSAEELEKHCQEIISDRRIKNRIVVLCEGKIQDITGRRSPQAYKRMSQMPDANFYKKCVPRTWIDKPRPQFFNCGNRPNVIDSYFRLLKIHDAKPTRSYLDKSKLFALVDLDIQAQKIDDYQVANTEEIYRSLYIKNQVISEQIAQHRIWTTGLIHREAYFIAPDIQQVFDCSALAPRYETNAVLLKDIYLEICDQTTNDIDLKKYFQTAIERIDYCQHINCCDLDKLKHTWNHEFQKSSSEQQKRELIFVLLTIRKAKKYWEQIKPDNNWNSDLARFREQLTLEIGSVYSRQDGTNPKNYLAYLLNSLYRLA